MGWMTSVRHRDSSEAFDVPPQGWRALPLPAQLYVAAVITGGAAVLTSTFPTTYPQPFLFACLLLFACLTSTWKVNLPIPVVNGSTLSVSYAANLMSLLLLGPEYAVVIAAAGVLTQCTYKAKYSDPVHRTVFSMAAAVLTMAASGVVYGWLGGVRAPVALAGLAKPLVGAIATYFLVNTSLVAAAIATSTSRTFARTWRDDFLWSGASFMVAGTAGALSAVVVARGEHWQAALLIAPIYLTYRTYELFVGRLEDQRRHTEEMRRLHEETVAALGQARAAERALGAEKERLALTLGEVTRLEEQRHQALDREQAARASAEAANRLKDQFLAVVSHELRTPLNAILGWADMLRRGKVRDDLRERAFQTIFDSAKRQAQLVDDLLDVSRIASGKLRLNRTLVDMAEVVRNAVEIVQPGAEAKRIQIAIEEAPPGGKVIGDSARLQQVVWNLLSNAVKFTPEGGAIRVSVRADRARNGIDVAVADTGVGVSREFLPAVFEAFRQADSSSTRVHPGLGLGLSIVKSLVEAHGGSVSAHSEGAGRGATFVVHLPMAIGRQPVWAGEAAQPSRRVEPLPVSSLEGVSVLIVDDDVETREVVAAHLEQCEASVLTAASAAQAFDVLRRQHVDVLLADIGMPDEDGYSLIRRVRALLTDAAAVPAAALTAFAREEDRVKALQAGFQMHIPKPVDAQSLISAVAALREGGSGASNAGTRL